MPPGRPGATCARRNGDARAGNRRGPLVVAVHLLDALAALLRLERERRGGTRDETRHADRLAGLLAVAVVAAAVVDHADRLLDLLQKLALAVARAELERVLLLERRAVGRVGRDLVLAQVLACVVRVLQELVAKLDQLASEER